MRDPSEILREHLEDNLRKDLEFLEEWEDKLRLAENPSERKKCETEINRFKLSIADQTSELYRLRAEALQQITTPTVRREELKGIIPDNILNAIEHEARHHNLDHIRIACAHTVWSCRPDRAKPILEDALRDYAETVKKHAKALLDRFY